MIARSTLLIALMLIVSGCVTAPRNGFTLDEWMRQSTVSGQFRATVAPEVLCVAKLLLDERTRTGRWPDKVEISRLGIDPSGSMKLFLQKNVELIASKEDMELVVWDLNLRRNRLRLEPEGKIWIFPGVFGTGSRERIHNLDSPQQDIVEVILSNLASSAR